MNELILPVVLNVFVPKTDARATTPKFSETMKNVRNEVFTHPKMFSHRARRSSGVSRISSSIHCRKIGIGTSFRSSTVDFPWISRRKSFADNSEENSLLFLLELHSVSNNKYRWVSGQSSKSRLGFRSWNKENKQKLLVTFEFDENQKKTEESSFERSSRSIVFRQEFSKWFSSCSSN